MTREQLEQEALMCISPYNYYDLADYIDITPDILLKTIIALGGYF
jgi:hypothetical protein